MSLSYASTQVADSGLSKSKVFLQKISRLHYAVPQENDALNFLAISNWPRNGTNRGKIGLHMDDVGSPATLLAITGKAWKGPPGWFMNFNVQQLEIMKGKLLQI
jgi:hypothetical protein